MRSLLACLLLASAPAAAAPLKLWHSYSGAERAGLDEALAAFAAAHPKIAVEPSFVPFDALTDKLGAAIPRGHGPDVFVFAHDRIGGWAEGGLLEPIELLVDEALLDRHATPCVFALAYGESLYGLPLAFKAQALYVRTDLVPDPPSTYEALVAIAKRHTDRAAGRFGLVYPNADLFFHTPLLFSLGGRVYGEDPSFPEVTNAGVVASLRAAAALAAEGVVPDDPTPMLAESMFSGGRAPLVQSGPWFRSQIDAGVPYTVVPLPAYPGGQPHSGFSTCEGVMMSRHSTAKPAAFALLRFLTSDLRAARPRMATGRQTVSLLEAWDAVLPGLDAKERAIFEAFRAAFERSTPSPSHPSMNAVWTPMNAALYKSIHRGMDPEEAAKQAQERIEKALPR